MKNSTFITLNTICIALFIFIGCAKDQIDKEQFLNTKQSIDSIINKHKKELKAKDIIVSVMNSETGKIEYIYNKHIAVNYTFEPGAVMMPISISLALDKNKVSKDETFYAYNKGNRNKDGEFPKGKYSIHKWTIGDDYRFKKPFLNIKDIVLYSSNIGTAIIANRLSGEEFYNGYMTFGFSKKTGIEIENENSGVIHTLEQYSLNDKTNTDNIYKATDSYGQGFLSTHMQVLKAYSVFNNNGKIITPYINSQSKESIQVISKDTANYMKSLLIDCVKEGTAIKAKINGVEIGGKTGTSYIVENSQYVKKYVSSFFGFVNHNEKKYTIGVTVIEPNSKGKQYSQYNASESAAPIIRDIIQSLL